MGKTKEKLVQVMDWSSAFWAGLIAGIIFYLLNVFVVPLFLGGNSWVIIRLFSSVFLGNGILAPPATYNLVSLIVSIFSVMLFSMLFTLTVTFILHRWGLLVGIVGGAIFGLAIYLINFYSLSYFFPWFYPMSSWSFLVTHILLGSVAGGVYESFEVEELEPE